MSTRNIKDAKDLDTGELIYFKGHAKATYMSDGTTVEDAINNIEAGSGTASNDYWDRGDYDNVIVTNNDVEINGNLSINHNNVLTATSIQCNRFENSTDNGYLCYNKSGISLEDENTDVIFSVTNTGDGTKFLSDDGTYKTVSGGSNEEIVEVTSRVGGITFNEYTISFEPNKIYFCKSDISDTVLIENVTPPTTDYAKYTLLFSTYPEEDLGLLSLTVPSNWIWINNTTPTLNASCHYELSVVAVKVYSDYVYKAILSEWKSN